MTRPPLGRRGDTPGERPPARLVFRPTNGLDRFRWRASAIGALVIALACAAILVGSDPGEFADEGETARVGLVLGLAAPLFWLRAGRRTTLGPEGVEVRGGLGLTTALPWNRVRALRVEPKGVRVLGTDPEGRAWSHLQRHLDDERHAFQDQLLERAPALALLAWGTGLDAVTPPRDHAGEPPKDRRPERVHEEGGAVVIEGPDGGRLAFDLEHPHHGAIRAAVEQRLVRWAARVN